MKTLNTLKICAVIFAARTFGRYEHSGWNGDYEYVKYSLFGRSWCIPTSAYKPALSACGE